MCIYKVFGYLLNVFNKLTKITPSLAQSSLAIYNVCVKNLVNVWLCFHTFFSPHHKRKRNNKNDRKTVSPLFIYFRFLFFFRHFFVFFLYMRLTHAYTSSSFTVINITITIFILDILKCHRFGYF